MHLHGIKPCLLAQLLLRKSVRYTASRQPRARRRAAFVSKPPNHHLLYLCNQSKLVKTNISESAVKFLFLTVACLCGGRAHRWSFLFKWNVLALASVKSFPVFPSGFSIGTHTRENGKRKLCWRAQPLEKLKWSTAHSLNPQRLKRFAQRMLSHCF